MSARKAEPSHDELLRIMAEKRLAQAGERLARHLSLPCRGVVSLKAWEPGEQAITIVHSLDGDMQYGGAKGYFIVHPKGNTTVAGAYDTLRRLEDMADGAEWANEFAAGLEP